MNEDDSGKVTRVTKLTQIPNFRRRRRREAGVALRGGLEGVRRHRGAHRLLLLREDHQRYGRVQAAQEDHQGK